MPNRKKAKLVKRITVTVNSYDYVALDQLARHSDVSASWLIRRSMREFLERYREDRTIDVRPGREVA